MTFGLRARLSGMMFLEFFIWGAWFVTLSTYLGRTLNFSGTEIALAYASMPWGAIAAPVIVGLVADRFFAAERMLALLHLAGAGLLWWAASMKAPAALFYVLLAYALCYNPTLSLVNAIALRQMQEPTREFPAVRAFGTAGWIAAGLVVGLSQLEATAVPLRLAAVASAVLGVVALFLPHTPAKREEEAISQRAGLALEALSLFRSRSFVVFVLACLLICIPLAFYYNFANLFLNEENVANAAGKMTLGQVSEFLCMLIMPFCFARLGVKWMLLVGMLAWALRYALFALGSSHDLMILFYFAIVLHGVCYDFFFVTGQIYIDQLAPRRLRASAQGLITLLTYGVGMLIGTQVSGSVVERWQETEQTQIVGHDWVSIWTVPAVMAVIVALMFAISFRTEKSVAPLATVSNG
jgi:nucleoside transporter